MHLHSSIVASDFFTHGISTTHHQKALELEIYVYCLMSVSL